MVWIALGLLAAISVFVVIVALRPASFVVQRSITIDAPADVIFPLVNDFRQWTTWSPWEGRDPNMRRTYNGPPAGVGANYHWAGDKNVGEGQMTIEQSDTPELIQLKLEFLKPFKATNQTRFQFTPEATGTCVDWTMTGTNNFFFKAFQMFCNMDKMVGGDFEKGLQQMKAVAERKTT